MPTRRAMWEALTGDFDLLIIGGGINGAGIARDAARRGLTVALVEMNDLAFGTSSRSSKLVHGGLRYLEQLEFSLVFESVSERRILQDMAPHLVNPLGFLFPVYGGAGKPLWMINTGIRLYEGLSLFRSPKRPRSLKPKDVAEIEPSVQQEGLKGAPLYYDCATDDARLTLETALDAAAQGAIVATWAKVTSFLKDETGRILGVIVKDQLGGELREVKARAVINATGPWTDATIAMSKGPTTSLLRPTKGVHVVVKHDKLPISNAVVCFHPTDRRVLFAIPWKDRTYLGTTDTDFEGDPAEVAATLEDVDYLIDAANNYFPDHQLGRDDVISTWAGIRPLMAPPGEEGEDVNESKVSREHAIVVGRDGLVTIAGGKLTTYRRMSAEVVDTAVRLLEMTDGPMDLEAARTDKEPLPGAIGWPANDDHARVAEEVSKAGHPHVPDDVAVYLANTYGMRGVDVAKEIELGRERGERLVEERPEVVGVIDWAVEQELAATICDVMVRRTQLFYRDDDQGLGALGAVADRMAMLLDWDAATKEREIERYRSVVASSRAWRSGLAE